MDATLVVVGLGLLLLTFVASRPVPVAFTRQQTGTGTYGPGAAARRDGAGTSR